MNFTVVFVSELSGFIVRYPAGLPMCFEAGLCVRFRVVLNHGCCRCVPLRAGKFLSLRLWESSPSVLWFLNARIWALGKSSWAASFFCGRSTKRFIRGHDSCFGLKSETFKLANGLRLFSPAICTGSSFVGAGIPARRRASCLDFIADFVPCFGLRWCGGFPLACVSAMQNCLKAFARPEFAFGWNYIKHSKPS